MTDAFRALYRYWAALLFLAVIVQVGAAGYGAFAADRKVGQGNGLTSKQFDHGFGLHIALGYIIFLASLVLFLLALGARLGRPRILLAIGMAGLVFLAIILALIGHKTPAVGILHPVDALAIVGVAALIAHRAWTGRAISNP